MIPAIINLLSRAVLQRFRQDQGKQYLQVTGKAGEVRSDVEQICQYGFRSRPLQGARGIMLAYAGNKQNATVINVDDKRYGQDTLEEGDVLVYNELSARITLRDDKILATADEEISATVNTSFAKVLDGTVETNVNGTKTVTTDGQIQSTVGSTTMTLTNSSIEFSVGGKTYTFDGTGMTTDGNISSTGAIDANGVDLETHVHSGVTSGPSNTGQPV